jgi:hypothetical protein
MGIGLVKMGRFGYSISELHRPNLVNDEQNLSGEYMCSNAQDKFVECERWRPIKSLVDLLIACFAV